LSLRSTIRDSSLRRNFVLPIEERRAERKWLARGRPAPPPTAIKYRNIMTMADLCGARVFVETGTLAGEMVARVLPRFDRVVSFEIFPSLAEAARRRFADEPNVRIIEGDSGALLADAIVGIGEPILFWLDAHYSGEGTGGASANSPIEAEIDIIHRTRIAAAHRDAVMIDDARCFTGVDGYPALDTFMAEIAERWNYTVTCADDCIFLIPKSAS
jgi:hypothetical protein